MKHPSGYMPETVGLGSFDEGRYESCMCKRTDCQCIYVPAAWRQPAPILGLYNINLKDRMRCVRSTMTYTITLDLAGVRPWGLDHLRLDSV